MKPLDVHENWGVIVSDFLREYHIDLRRELKAMSWNYFCMLLANLSQESNWIRLTIHEHNKPFEKEPYDPNKETYTEWRDRQYERWLEYKETHPEPEKKIENSRAIPI